MANYAYAYFGCFFKNHRFKIPKKCEIRVDKTISVANNILHVLIHINIDIKNCFLDIWKSHMVCLTTLKLWRGYYKNINERVNSIYCKHKIQ